MHSLHIFLLSILVTHAALSVQSCIEHEREGLLKFKAGLTDPSNRSASWRGNKCCNWAGVRCSNRTGHVVKLNLRNCNDYYLRGKISSSLLALSELNYLDLSCNDFGGNKFPKFIGSFRNLKYLNLSYTHLSGKIPPQIGNLSRLQYLDLSCSSYTLDYTLDADTWWLSNLKSLRHLDMSGVVFEDSNDWVQTLNKLPSLDVLVLGGNGLTEIPDTLPFVNFTSLRVLDISYQNFNTTLPDWLWSLPSLTKLILSGNNLVGPFPAALNNLTSLDTLALDSNSFEGMIPPLHSLTKLTDLSLSHNNIEGDIAELVGQLSNYTLGKLERLGLSETNLTGNLSGWIREMSSLSYLRLSYNNLNGKIPVDIGNLSNLATLDLSSNSFTGLLSEIHLTCLSKLEYLDLSNNSITIAIDSNWNPPFQLHSIYLSQCKLGPMFPTWFRHQVETGVLDISDSEIDDTIPGWFWNLSSLQLLDMSNNRLRGELPASLVHMTRLGNMDLSNNKLEGEIPFLPRCLSILKLSNNSFSGQLRKYESPYKNNSILSNSHTGGSAKLFPCGLTDLVFLDLASNNLSGPLPPCWSNISYLLNLANNKLSGTVPSSFNCSVVVLDLHNNSLTGEFPSSLQFCFELELLDLGENKFHGKISEWIGEGLPKLEFLRLRSNLFSGNIPSTLTLLSSVQVLDLANNYLSGPLPANMDNFTILSSFDVSQRLDSYLIGEEWLSATIKGRDFEYGLNGDIYLTSIDLSNNNLSGWIPKKIVALVGLMNLNLSHNHLIGGIPVGIGKMISLESLDLRMNNLSGTIPKGMSALNSLGVLNLSYNNLSGSIPTGYQLQTLDDPSIYMKNPYLCGPPLQRSCSSDVTFPGSNNDSERESHGDMWFYLFIEFGFVVGFLGVIFVLLCKRGWRYAYFQMIDNGFNRLYVLGALTLKRLRKE